MVFVAIDTPSEYTSSVVVKPILSNPDKTVGGNLSGLAAIAGINLEGADASADSSYALP